MKFPTTKNRVRCARGRSTSFTQMPKMAKNAFSHDFAPILPIFDFGQAFRLFWIAPRLFSFLWSFSGSALLRLRAETTPHRSLSRPELPNSRNPKNRMSRTPNNSSWSHFLPRGYSSWEESMLYSPHHSKLRHTVRSVWPRLTVSGGPPRASSLERNRNQERQPKKQRKNVLFFGTELASNPNRQPKKSKKK